MALAVSALTQTRSNKFKTLVPAQQYSAGVCSFYVSAVVGGVLLGPSELKLFLTKCDISA